MRAFSLFLAPLALHAQEQEHDLEAPTPGIPTTPALRDDVNGATNKIPQNWYCDLKHKVYCQNGATCCPWPNGKWSCAVGDSQATCYSDLPRWNHYCPHTSPIICNFGCCSANTECVGKRCRRIKNQSLPMNETGPALSSIAVLEHPNVAFRPAVFTAMDAEFAANLHNMILPHFAASWRQKPGAAQCWVLGYPQDLFKCPKTGEVWESGCHGKHTYIQVPRGIKVETSMPPMHAVAYSRQNWCNDGEQTHTQTFEYKRTVTDSSTLTLSGTISLEFGTNVEASCPIEIVTAKASFHTTWKFSFSVSYAQTHTVQQSMTSRQTIKIGPRSRVQTVCWTNKGTIRSPFSVDVILQGNVVWACTSNRGSYLYLTYSDAWTMDKLQKTCQQVFGLSKEQFDEIRTKTIHGVLESSNAYDVECSTHVEHLKPGESCRVTEKEIVV